jgi:hypothetical protein
VTASNSGFGQAFLYIYWLAVLFFAGLGVAQLMGSYGPIVVVFMLPFSAAMVLLAVRIWRAAAPATLLCLCLRT